MSIPIIITNGLKSQAASIYDPSVDGREGESGLVVYSRDREARKFSTFPLLNQTFGLAMNQNGAFTGTPVLVHDGGDNAGWTGGNVTGAKATFASTDQASADSASVKINRPSVGDVWNFDKGSDLTVSSYVAISMQIYIDSGWSSGDSVEIYGYDSNTASQVGDRVKLEFFISEFTFGVFQPAVITFTDLNLTGTIDEFRMELVSKSGLAPLFYIDEFQVEELDGAIDFTLRPKSNEIFHATMISNFVVNDVTATVMGDYNKFFGETELNNGLLAIVQEDGIALASLGVTRLSQFEPFPIAPLTDIRGGTTHATGKITTTLELNFDGRKGDFFTYRVQDDLRGLTDFSTWFTGWIEKV